jgi:predicted RNase H-like nuclease
MLAPVRFLGIDLAWGEGTDTKPANGSGVVALEANGRISDAGWTIGLAETLEWIARASGDDTSLFVDAPLVVSNATGQRPAEREVGERYGRWWVSANSTNLASPRLAGVHLREHLELLGWRYDDGRDGPPTSGLTMSECYPYTPRSSASRSSATTTSGRLQATEEGSAGRRGMGDPDRGV